MAKQEHWAIATIPSIVVAVAVVALAVFAANSSMHTGHRGDAVPPATFRTTDLLVDNTSALGNVVTLSNEAFAAPTGSVNDLDPWSGGTHTSRLEIDTTAAGSSFDVTGIVAGTEGDLLYVWNGGGGNADTAITFTNADPSSSANNRFQLPHAGPYTLRFQDGALFIYLGGFGWSLLQGDGGGNVTPIQLSLSPVRPTALVNGSTTNNYNPWGANVITPTVYQDTGATSTISGIVAPNAGTVSFAQGNDGATLAFVNISPTGTITMMCNAAGSLPENRIACATSIVLTPYSSVELIYDNSSSGIWRVRSLALSP